MYPEMPNLDVDSTLANALSYHDPTSSADLSFLTNEQKQVQHLITTPPISTDKRDSIPNSGSSNHDHSKAIDHRVALELQKIFVALDALSSRIPNSDSIPLLPFPQNATDPCVLNFPITAVKTLWKNAPALVVDANDIAYTAKETMIDNALQRVFLKIIPPRKLQRGDIIQINHPNVRRHNDIKFIISNTQCMDEWWALVRIVGYHVCGHWSESPTLSSRLWESHFSNSPFIL